MLGETQQESEKLNSHLNAEETSSIHVRVKAKMATIDVCSRCALREISVCLIYIYIYSFEYPLVYSLLLLIHFLIGYQYRDDRAR